MTEPIKVLLVEDVHSDAELALRELKRAGIECIGQRVQTEEAFLDALSHFEPQIILSDFRMPKFDGLSALAIAHEFYPDIPFIFVSGTLGEEHAIRTLQNGAVDYVLKSNLARLPAAVERALRDAEARTERRVADARIREAEMRFQATFEQAAVGIAHVDAGGRILLVNRRLAGILGYEPAEMVGEIIQNLSHPADVEAINSFLPQLSTGRIETFTLEKRYLHREGQVIWMQVTVSLMRGPDGDFLNYIGVFEDITERKRADDILSLEHAVTRCLAEADAYDAGATQKTIIRAICESENWCLGRYFSLDEAAGLMRFEEFWARENPAVDRFIADLRGRSYRPGEGLIGAAWQSGDLLLVPDAAADPRVEHVATVRASGLRSAVVFPVRAAAKIVGVFAFWSQEASAPDARLLRAVPVIGGQIGQFMVRQAQQRQIARLNRIHKVLSGINSLIVRVRDRGELFREACRIAVEDGKFSLAWLGIVDHDAMQLKVVASHDNMQAYVELIPLGLAESAPGGLGMAGRAVFERQPIIANNIESDSQLVLLKQEALGRGFRSMAVLPLMDAENITGVLALYADTPDFFDQEEMKLLQELAGDISFAIDHLEKVDQLNYLAYYDALTGLANRTLFLERATVHIEAARARGHQLAVLLVDIERFKLINESLGRAAGDSLLQQVAGRFLDNPADQARHARVGVDLFAVVVPEVQSEEELARRIEARMERNFGPRFTTCGTELKIAVRVGAALYPSCGGDAEALLTNAESALKRAKASGERYLFYTPQMTERLAGRLTLENQLRQALEREEFVLHYQPKMNLITRRIESVEALIRWRNPELGLVPPLQFIPLMEQTGLILEVGAWALRQAVRDYRTMQELGMPLRIAVNVSPIQLRRANFVETIKQAISDGGEATGIDLEITESVMMEDIEGSIDKLNAVRALGMKIAIDDFGTGYSSLGYLARLPADAVKIDRSFILPMLEQANTMTLVSTIISLARSLNLKLIAEGVETKAQEQMLGLLRCDEIQGYLISPALPLQELLAFTRQWAQHGALQPSS